MPTKRGGISAGGQNFHAIGISGSLAEFVEVSHLCQLASFEYGHTVTENFNIGKYMRAHEDCLSFIPECRNQVTHLASTYRIKPAHRLVKEYYCRIVD